MEVSALETGITSIVTTFSTQLIAGATAVLGIVGGYFALRYGVPALLKFVKSILK